MKTKSQNQKKELKELLSEVITTINTTEFISAWDTFEERDEEIKTRTLDFLKELTKDYESRPDILELILQKFLKEYKNISEIYDEWGDKGEYHLGENLSFEPLEFIEEYFEHYLLGENNSILNASLKSVKDYMSLENVLNINLSSAIEDELASVTRLHYSGLQPSEFSELLFETEDKPEIYRLILSMGKGHLLIHQEKELKIIYSTMIEKQVPEKDMLAVLEYLKKNKKHIYDDDIERLTSVIKHQDFKEKQPNIEEIIECSQVETHLSYDVLGILGRGVSGTTYKVFSRELKVTRALKVFYEMGENSSKEAELLAKLIPKKNVKNVIQVYEAGDEFVRVKSGDNYAILTEYINGQTIEELLSKTTINPLKVVLYGIQILQGLKELRRVSIYHRDLHDRNIMIDEENDRAVIIDLGAATTNPNEVHEQNRLYGGNNDLISLGLLMYKMATGHNLFSDESGHSYREEIKDNIKTEREKTYEDPTLKKAMINKVRTDIEGGLRRIIMNLLDDDLWTQPSIEQVKQTQKYAKGGFQN